ncbi:MAG: hypothetical protein R3D58_10425 [Saprospiraceae bacterium]|nr:hypothetical protein [Lewinellaceae bacterium]
MKIENLNTDLLVIGVLFFEEYNTPYIESAYKELDLVIQAFRPMLDNVGKVEKLINDSIKLKEGNSLENCIGENETMIYFNDGYFQFDSIVLSPEIYLELEASSWFMLLENLKSFMIKQKGKKFKVRF